MAGLKKDLGCEASSLLINLLVLNWLEPQAVVSGKHTAFGIPHDNHLLSGVLYHT